jgi:hypothetical protein
MDMIKRAGAHSGDQTYPTGWLCDVHTASALRLKCVVGTGPPRALHLRSGRRTMNREQGEQNSPVPQAGLKDGSIYARYDCFSKEDDSDGAWKK